MTGATTREHAEPAFRRPLPARFFERDSPFDPPAALREHAERGPAESMAAVGEAVDQCPSGAITVTED
ncbi:hypothetical protein ACTG9Q_26420 [Actinokineospora sp. 24-640]